jgi:hypothetical protein
MCPKEEEEVVVDAKDEGLIIMVVVVIVAAVLVGMTGSALVFMEDLQLHYKKCYRFCVHVFGHIPARSISVEFHQFSRAPPTTDVDCVLDVGETRCNTPSRAVLFFITAVNRYNGVVINRECCGAKASALTDLPRRNRPTEYIHVQHTY